MILYGLVMSILTVMGISSVGADADNATLVLGSEENDFYGKLSILSSTFAPTALLPLGEFDAFLHNSQLKVINRQCIEDSRHYVRALWNQSEWALSMYHASGRLSIDESTNFLIADGLGINVHQDPGLFDQCIATSYPSGRVRGQYCSVFLSAQPILQHDGVSLLNEPKVTLAERQLHISAPVNIADSIIGFCLPSSCSAKDLQTAVAHKIGRTTFKTKHKNGTVTTQSIVTSNHDRFCHSQIKIQKEHAWDPLCVVFIVAICFIGLLILISTLHEYWIRTLLGRPLQNTQNILDDGNVLPIRILHCFSAMKNVKYLLATEPLADDIQCLHGIRVLSFFLIILSHMGVEIFRHPQYNKGAQIQAQTSWYGQPLTNLSVLVDTFFLMGGLLVCTSLLKILDSGRFSLRRFYFNRYLRLTPLYAVIIFFLTAFDSRLGSGPNWISAMYRSEDCRSYWWSHLLYINNRAPFFMTFCMVETWYLSTEMQMFIFSPIVVYPLWKWPKRALGPLLIALLLAASFSYSTAIFLAWDLPITLIITRSSVMKRASEYLQLYNVNPFTRCPPYLIGILLGWILHKTKNSKIYLSKPTMVIGWILSIVMIMAVLYGPFPYLDEERTPLIDPLFSVIYGVFHRTIWSIAITWIIFVCAKGYGGKVNDLLSSKIFVPLAKISFSGYLVHNNVIGYYVSQFRIPFYYTPIQLVVTYFGILVLTLVISAFLTITIEMPFLSSGALLIQRKDQTGSPPIIIKRKSTKEQ